MKLLITGATGAVGKVLIPFLQENTDYSLVLLVRNKKKAETLFGENKNIIFISTDSIECIRKENPDYVVHLAASITSKDDEEAMNSLLSTNVVFSSKLLFQLQYCPNLKLFVNFGTFAEYRFGPSEVNNAYLYSATKSAFKEILRYYADKFHFHYINIVPYTIYGGNDGQKKVIDYLKDSMESPSPIDMTNGEQVLDFIHVKDVVAFIAYVLSHSSDVIAKNYNDYFLGTGRGTSIRELAELLESKYQRKCNVRWGGRNYRPRDVMYAVAPIGHLLDLGWKPEITLEESL